MASPNILCNREGLARTCGLKESTAQPRCIALPKIEGVAEYPSLVPATRMHRAQAIILDLADIENRLIAVLQTHRHDGMIGSRVVWRKCVRCARRTAAALAV